MNENSLVHHRVQEGTLLPGQGQRVQEARDPKLYEREWVVNQTQIVPAHTTRDIQFSTALPFKASHLIVPSLPFKASHLIVPSNIGPHFDVMGIRVGNRNQIRILPNDSIPAIVFSEERLRTKLNLDTCQPHETITLTVRNRTNEDRTFGAAFVGNLFGQLVED